MDYRYPRWPRMFLLGSEQPDQSMVDWARAQALGEETFGQSSEIPDAAECTCLDRSLAELEDLLQALDAYQIDH